MHAVDLKEMQLLRVVVNCQNAICMEFLQNILLISACHIMVITFFKGANHFMNAQHRSSVVFVGLFIVVLPTPATEAVRGSSEKAKVPLRPCDPFPAQVQPGAMRAPTLPTARMAPSVMGETLPDGSPVQAIDAQDLARVKQKTWSARGKGLLLIVF